MSDDPKETTVNVKWGPFGQEFTLRPEYAVHGSRAFAAPYDTKTLDQAREFQVEYGGEIMVRLVSDEQAVR